MSRKEIVGDQHTIAFGVDHVTGAFAQLWVNPTWDQDGAFVTIDSTGVHVRDEQGTLLTAPLSRYLDLLEKAMKLYQLNNPGSRFSLSEQHVITLAASCGDFPDITEDVYRTFGADI